MGASSISGWLQPMFINIDEQLVLAGCRILRPDMRLVETHQVEKLHGESIAAVRQRFRIRKSPMQRFDDTGLTLNICGSSEVSRWRAHTDAHRIAWLEFGRHTHLLNCIAR